MTAAAAQQAAVATTECSIRHLELQYSSVSGMVAVSGHDLHAGAPKVINIRGPCISEGRAYAVRGQHDVGDQYNGASFCSQEAESCLIRERNSAALHTNTLVRVSRQQLGSVHSRASSSSVPSQAPCQRFSSLLIQTNPMFDCPASSLSSSQQHKQQQNRRSSMPCSPSTEDLQAHFFSNRDSQSSEYRTRRSSAVRAAASNAIYNSNSLRWISAWARQSKDGPWEACSQPQAGSSSSCGGRKPDGGLHALTRIGSASLSAGRPNHAPHVAAAQTEGKPLSWERKWANQGPPAAALSRHSTSSMVPLSVLHARHHNISSSGSPVHRSMPNAEPSLGCASHVRRSLIQDVVFADLGSKEAGVRGLESDAGCCTVSNSRESQHHSIRRSSLVLPAGGSGAGARLGEDGLRRGIDRMQALTQGASATPDPLGRLQLESWLWLSPRELVEPTLLSMRPVTHVTGVSI